MKSEMGERRNDIYIYHVRTRQQRAEGWWNTGCRPTSNWPGLRVRTSKPPLRKLNSKHGTVTRMGFVTEARHRAWKG